MSSPSAEARRMTGLKAFTMPKWGIEMSEGTITEWLVAEDEPFARGAVLTAIETDKITNEVEAEAAGRFVRLIAQAGETLPVGALLAVLSDGGAATAAEIDAVIAGFRQADTSFGDTADAPPAPVPAPAPPAPAIPDGLAISPAARDRAQSAGVDVTAMIGTGRGGRVTAQDVDQATRTAPDAPLSGAYPPTPASDAFASPLAKRLAHLHGVDLGGLAGSGHKGRIGKADVLAAAPEPSPRPAPAPVAPPAPTPAVVPAGGVDVLPMSSMRRTIARRLTESKQTIPHFYIRRRVRADRLLALRAAVQGQRPSVNDYLIKACALALMEVPQVNIQVHGTDIHRFAQADVAVAVATEKGLVTPIVTGANLRSVADISATMAALAQRAKSGRLKPEEFGGGSFSLSNLGGFGVEQFDAIINPPQGAILAVGAARPEPIDDAGAFRIVPVFHLSLSCDHRAIDGADGGRFMQALAALIEHPHLLD